MGKEKKKGEKGAGEQGVDVEEAKKPKRLRLRMSRRNNRKMSRKLKDRILHVVIAETKTISFHMSPRFLSGLFLLQRLKLALSVLKIISGKSCQFIFFAKSF